MPFPVGFNWAALRSVLICWSRQSVSQRLPFLPELMLLGKWPICSVAHYLHLHHNSRVVELTKLWRESLTAAGKQKLADAIADPSENDAEYFADYADVSGV